jgi:peptidoglycan/LPS O-acetylase OafA/YrhL
VNVHAHRFPLIDSLRAVSALVVVAAHAALYAGLYSSGSRLAPYVVQFTVAAPIFFMISGFLLYRPFVRARVEGRATPSIGAYAWRRVLRIVPAYWVALTLVAIWLSLETVIQPAWHVPLIYGFGQIYTSGTSQAGLGQAWTLCVEATFYVCLPLWVLAFRRIGWRAELVALAAVVGASIGWQFFALAQADPKQFGPFSGGPWLHPLPNFMDYFALGMALAVISVHGLPQRVARWAGRAWLWWLVAAVLFWVCSTQIGMPALVIGHGTYVLQHELQGLVALALIMPSVFGKDEGGAVRRVMGWPPVLYVGLISYGLYLWQNALVIKIGGATRGWMADTLGLGPDARFVLLFLLVVAPAIAIGSLSYYAVERPMLRLIRLVRPPRGREPGEALAEPAPATTIGQS